MYAFVMLTVCSLYKQGGADKSLARPGRKQATATKLRTTGTVNIFDLCSGILGPTLWRAST